VQLRAGLDAELGRACGVEPAGPLVLHERVTERLRAVLDRVRADPVAVEHHGLVRRKLHEPDLVGELPVDPAQVAHEGVQSARPVDRERRGATAQRERLQHSRQPEEVVGVEVGEKDVLDVRQADRAQQLPLRALAAIDQQAVAAAPDQEARGRALHRWHRAGRAEKENREVHRARIFAKRAGETKRAVLSL
jgi:hypothetical protein